MIGMNENISTDVKPSMAASNKKTVTQKNYAAILAYMKLKKSGRTVELIAVVAMSFGLTPKTAKGYIHMFADADIIDLKRNGTWQFIQKVN